MINGTSAVQSVMVVGGSSEIGLAAIQQLSQSNRLQRIVLVGRNLEKAVRQIVELGHEGKIETLDVDLTVILDLESKIRGVWKEGIDVVVLSAGVLPEPTQSPLDASIGVEAALVNFVAQMAIGSVALELMLGQGAGTLVVVSSVAVERPRKDNFVYGSSKAGLDLWAQGMADYLHGLPIRILVVRPGMVRTRMSRHLPEAPMTVNADVVAKAIEMRLVHGPVIVWVPSRIRWLCVGLRHLPRWVFRRLGPSGGSPLRPR